METASPHTASNDCRTASLRLEPSTLEHVAEQVMEVLYDLIPALLKDLGGYLLASADRPVFGTKHSIMGFRLDPVLLNKQLHAALRAKGLDVPDWDFVSVNHLANSLPSADTPVA